MRASTLVLVTLTAGLAALAAVGDRYLVDLLTTGLAFGLLAAAVDLSLGRCGVPNLGPALSFGLGGYFTAASLKAGWGMCAGVLGGVGVGVAVAAVVGAIGLRSRATRIQFGLIGLVLSLAAEQLAISLYTVAGGSNGISNVPRPTLGGAGWDMPLTDPRRYFAFVAVIALALLYAVVRLAGSHAGRVMVCVRDDPTKAEALGYSPFRVRFGVSLVTAAVAAVAGGLYVPVSGIAHPAMFGVAANMLVLVWVAVGGTGTIVGPFTCAACLKLIESELGSANYNLYVLALGVLFVGVVLFFPEGVAGRLRTVLDPQPRANNGTTGT